MKTKNNILNRFLAVTFFIVFFQAGCATTVQKQTFKPTGEVSIPSSAQEEIPPALSPVKLGIGLVEITDSKQIPDFKDDFDKTSLLYAIDNSRVYFEKIKSYPDTFKSIGFTPEKQTETLMLFREGYLKKYKNPKDLKEFIAENFRIFQVVDKQNNSDVQFAGYGFDTLSDEVVTTFKQYLVHYGTTGLPVNPMRSMRIKEGAFPLGALAFAVIEKGGQTEKSFFVFAHETGSSIHSATHADVFFGIGEDAVKKARNFNTDGRLYYLLKR